MQCQRWNAEKQDWDDFHTPFWQNHHSSKQNTSTIDNYQEYDLIIFNFPHSDQAGRATKLVKAQFEQIRICNQKQYLSPNNNITIEMRLRTIPTNPALKKNIRSLYNHEEAAKESGFVCVDCWDGDLERWMRWGYEHKRTKKNVTCRDIVMDCKVWRWIDGQQHKSLD